MNEKLELLNKATDAYNEGIPFMTDEEWDNLYFELGEQAQNIRYKVVNELQKVEHEYPMLSLDKTKDVDDIFDFIGNRDVVIMGKMDGLTCALTYLDGELVRAETRGNGVIGEDITHNAMVIPSIPKKIEYKDKLTVFGEIICKYDDFEEFSDKYKNPRNFAAGSIRLLDANECAKRKLTFVAWDAIAPSSETNSLGSLLNELNSYLFTVVPFGYISYFPGETFLSNNEKDEKLTFFDFVKIYFNNVQELCQELSYPIDGLVIKYDNIMLSQTLGRTEHHFNNALAFKFYDEEYETTLIDIEWSMGRTGVLTPIAIFEPIDIDGSTVSRASLHNLSIMEELSGGFERKGDTLFIYKANMIIPQVSKWIHNGEYNEENHINLPTKCPICGDGLFIKEANDTKTMVCGNPSCQGKLINRLDHFASQKGLDIKGLSTKTIEKLIDEGFVSNIVDLYEYHNWADKLCLLPGFGSRSIEKLTNSIEESKNCTLQQFLCAIGIPLVGTSVSKIIADTFNNYISFRNAVKGKFEFYKLPTIGPEIHNAIINFNYKEVDELAYHELYITNPKEEKKEEIFAGQTFVITGKLKEYKNRAELETVIKQYGGKVSSSVSKNTTYLINNDINSTSSKNESAKKLGVKIITEENFKNFLDL